MSDPSGGFPVGDEHAPRRPSLLRASATTLTISAEIALVLGAAASAAMLLGAGGAPSWVFVVQCTALGLAATLGLAASRAQHQQRGAVQRRTVLRERRRMRAREELVANLSHDLRNPLAVALGFSEMAEDEELPADERTQALSGLRRSLWEMSQLVENVLDGSADQAGELTPSLEPVELEPMCADVVAATRVLLRRRPVTLSGEVEPGMVALADRQRLLRVLGNLLGNACKYTVAGEIRLEAMACGRFAVIQVQDTGPGIAPEAVPYIFDRFRRAHRGGPAGAGLGLAIAQRLVERMGGTLEVSSALGVGSTFTVTLPLVAAERSASAAA